MACDVIHTWTFCSLVGAFLDLTLAYLVLCGSAIAFFVEKFFGIFGLNLPCPRNGLFGDPDCENECRCVQRVLIEFPARRISSVQMSVQRRFPFDRIWMKGRGNANVKLLQDSETHDRFLEMDSENGRGRLVESSCSYSEIQGRDKLDTNDDSVAEQDVGKFAIENRGGLGSKAKTIWNQRSRSGLRRQRKFVAEHRRKSSAVSEAHVRLVGLEYPTCSSEHGEETSGESFPSGLHGKTEINVTDFVESPPVEEPVERGLCDTESKGVAMDAVTYKCRNWSENGAASIKTLEEALEEEHAARSALYLELEKERSAAASAADEAMAMISRLHEEKAVIEMESRQYQRMIEEKAAYDAEEMNILKEILLRREREKLVLEKEVEVYREILFSGKTDLSDEESQYDREGTTDRDPIVSFDMNHGLGFLLQQINASLTKEKTLDVKRYPDTYFGALMEAQTNYKEPPLVENAQNNVSLIDVCSSSIQVSSSMKVGLCGFDSRPSQSAEQLEKLDMQFDEKTQLVAVDTNVQACPLKLQDSSPSNQLCGIPVENVPESTSSLHTGTEQKKNKWGNVISDGTFQRDQCPSGSRKEKNVWYGSDQLEDHGVNSHANTFTNFVTDRESGIYDVHVVDDNIDLGNASFGQESGILLARAIIRENLPFESSSSDPSNSSKYQAGLSVERSSSDTNSELHALNYLEEKVPLIGPRRHSIPVIDSEKLRLNNEVGWLTERLRAVQEGRKRLNIPTGRKEKEKLHLQLLEEIALQLREIHQPTEPGKAVRSASLPPPSKASSKKRPCRSTSRVFGEST